MVSPSGVVFHGNQGLKVGNYSVTGGAADDLNNVENVIIQTPEMGTWKVYVEAAEINQDSHLETKEVDADFALVGSVGK